MIHLPQVFMKKTSPGDAGLSLSADEDVMPTPCVMTEFILRRSEPGGCEGLSACG